jgi:phage terminase large subunit
VGKFGQQRVGIVPDATKADRINAARRVLPRCSFHATKTEKGRDGLSNWAYVYDEERKEFSKEPDHNWASHDGDAYSYGALVLEERVIETPMDERARVLAVGDLPDGFARATLNDMWEQHDREHARLRGRV